MMLKRVSIGCAIALVGLTTWGVLCAEEPQFSAEDLEFFEKRVRPVLAQRCFECHGAKSEKLRGGLRLDSRDAVLRGGDTGPAVVPGEPAKSLLVEAIGFQSAQIEMPPSGKLPENEIADLKEWVRRGLPFPSVTTTTAARAAVDLEMGRRHWAFQPLQAADLTSALPDARVAEQAGGSAIEPARGPVDVLLRAAQPNRRVRPSPTASRAVLLRRLKFMLLGLPPTVDEVADFVADDAPDAYDRLVDRLLARPQYGERWGRVWLDLVRYCDVPESWREGEAKAYHYRDWTIRAFNHDLGYAEFVRKQLAADLLPGAEPADNAALGLLGLSPSYWKELKLDHNVIKQVVAEEWEERIDALGGTFLGLTLACARCHDHKFDPVTMQDYYALAGVLASVRQDDRPVVAAEVAQAAKQARERVKALEKEIEKLAAMKPVSEENQRAIDERRGEIDRLRRETPYFDLPPAFGLVEASLHVLPDGPNRTKLDYRPQQPQDIALQIRGNPAKLGPVVPRRFLSVLSRDPSSRFQEGSGRRELAEAIVTDAAPLAGRVYVNRIWKQVFGRGLVTTPSNFGLQAERPTHPELLDDLARRFYDHDGSSKWLVRELVASATFRQSSALDADRQQIDPENVWLGQMTVRRLEVEAWRDAMLAVADQLDATVGGPPRELLDAAHRRRTVYGVIRRRELNDLLRLFDFPDPVAHSANREPTTTPLQQLFVFNSPFFQQQASALGSRILADHAAQPAEQVRDAYERLFGREPSAAQLAVGVEFLESLARDGQSPAQAWQQYAQALLASNEFLFVD